jgi:hypothetical protein
VNGDPLGAALEGGWQTNVRRVGNTVFRSSGPQSRSVIALLHHLHGVGFDAAPRPIDGGFALDGREQLTYIDGESPQPLAWSEDAAWIVGDMLRRLHAATAGFTPPEDVRWRPCYGALHGVRGQLHRCSTTAD